MAIEISGPSISTISGENGSGSVEKRNRDHTLPPTGQRSSNETDSLTITRDADMLKKIEDALNRQPTTDDNNRISQLKASIDAGGYNVDPLRVADKFIQFEIGLAR